MDKLREINHTIVSLVTAPVNQNIAIIRISGTESYRIINEISSKHIPSLPGKESRIILTKIKKIDLVIDQVLLFCFYTPNSFTGEDTIEISCHGNLLIVNQIIEIILEKGAKLANPGEFSKRAFFNNKLNLIQASAIDDIIKAPNISATHLALQNLNSKRKTSLDELEEKILAVIANIEVNIDYPEYEDVERITINSLKEAVNYFTKEICAIEKNIQKSRLYNQGLKIGIFGRPNVGKSTLLNRLIKEERAIVAPLAGTTRDVVEVSYMIKGIPLSFFDTAGLRKSKNLVEKEGIKKTYSLLEKVDISFLVLDHAKKWTREDEEVFHTIGRKNKYLVIVNKSDLPGKIFLPDFIPTDRVVKISAEKNEIDQLEEKIAEDFFSTVNESFANYPFLSKSWQQSRVKQIKKILDNSLAALNKNIPVDIITSDLQNCFRLLRELSGKDHNEDLLEIIFSKFCLGK